SLARRRLTSPLFPYTTLFRSSTGRPADALGSGVVTETLSVSSPGMDGSGTRGGLYGDMRWGVGPNCVASRTPSHATGGWGAAKRSEEHTSELQSRENLVCRLL